MLDVVYEKGSVTSNELPKQGQAKSSRLECKRELGANCLEIQTEKSSGASLSRRCRRRQAI